jgi:hypothetical protein
MLHLRFAIAFCLALIALVACKPEKSAAPDAALASGALAAKPRLADACPVKIAATTVTVMNLEDGVALYFSTLEDNIEEVRRRTVALAHVMTPGSQPVSESSSGERWESLARRILVPLTASAEPTEDGARLVLKPIMAEDLERLRTYARVQGDRMRLGACSADLVRTRPTLPSRSESQATSTGSRG